MTVTLSKTRQVLAGVGKIAKEELADLGRAGEDLARAIESGDGVAAAAKRGALEVRDSFVDVGGGLIGLAGILGMTYPVTAYQAQVSPALSRGSRLGAGGLDALAAQGFRGVVNLCAENDADSGNAARLGMSSLRLAIIDNTPPTQAQMKQFLDFVSDPAHQPAYVHCQAGKGRTGVAVACYRMAVDGWTAEKALAEAKKFGLGIPEQEDFILQFGTDLAAGRIAGYPAKP